MDANKYKLGGADLSNAIKKAYIPSSTQPSDTVVTVALDKDQLKNFSGIGTDTTVTTTEKVTIKKRDLTSAGTKITMKYSYVTSGVTVNDLANFLTFTGTEGTELNLTKGTDYTIEVRKTNGDAVPDNTLTAAGAYNVTVTGNGTSCTGSQTFQVSVAPQVIKEATYANVDSYKPSYTGTEVKPSKSDLGAITLKYLSADGTNTTSQTIQDSEWEIIGYTNNINATVYKTKVNPFVKTLF